MASVNETTTTPPLSPPTEFTHSVNSKLNIRVQRRADRAVRKEKKEEKKLAFEAFHANNWVKATKGGFYLTNGPSVQEESGFDGPEVEEAPGVVRPVSFRRKRVRSTITEKWHPTSHWGPSDVAYKAIDIPRTYRDMPYIGRICPYHRKPTLSEFHETLVQVELDLLESEGAVYLCHFRTMASLAEYVLESRPCNFVNEDLFWKYYFDTQHAKIMAQSDDGKTAAEPHPRSQWGAKGVAYWPINVPRSYGDMPYIGRICPYDRDPTPEELHAALLKFEQDLMDYDGVVYLCHFRSMASLADYVPEYRPCNFSNEDTFWKYYFATCRSRIKAQSDCCRRHCEGECVTKFNRAERRERMKEAEKKRKSEALKAEKQRLLRQLEKNKKLRERAHLSLLKKMQAQALDTVIQSATDAITLPTTVTNTLHNVDDSLSAFKTMLDKVIKYFSDIGESLLPQGYDIVSIGIALYSIFNCVITKSYFGIGIQLFSLSRMLKVDYKYYYEYFLKLAYGKSDSLEAQSLFAGILPVKVLGSGLLTVISMICGGKGSALGFAASHLAEFGRAAVGWTKMIELFEWFKNCFVDMYYRCTLGKTLAEVKLEEDYPKLASALARVSLLRNEPHITSYIDRDAKICNHIIELDDDLTSIRYAALRAKDNALVSHITSLQSQLKETFLSARNSAAYSNKSRSAPTSLYVYGKSSVGKSNLMKYIKFAIYKKKYADCKTWNINTISHPRDVKNEFWDGYMGQPILEYDDMMQTKDCVAVPNPEILEFIRVKNDAPFHLHMSSVQDKKNCYFNSPYVLASSNEQNPKIESIANPTAFLRRWDVVIEVRVNPHWGKSSLCQTYTVIDDRRVAKGPHAFNKDVYNIDLYNFGASTPTIIKQDMSLDEFMDYFWEVSEKNLTKSNDLRESILEQLGMGEPDGGGSEEFLEKFEKCLEAQMDVDGNPIAHCSKDFLPDLSQKSSDKTKDFIDDFLECKGKETKISDTISETFEDACDAIDSAADFFLKPIKEKVAPVVDHAQRIYDEAMNSKLVRNFSTFVENSKKKLKETTNVLSGWLYSFFTSKQWYGLLSVGGIALAGWGMSRVFGQYFGAKRCSYFASPTLDQLRSTTCECETCDQLLSDHDVGTYQYAVDVLLYMLSKEEKDKTLHLNWLKEAISKSSPEVVRKASSQHAELSQYFSESREAHVRSPKHKFMSESRESNIKVNPFKLRPESLPCNVIDIKGSVIKAQSSDLVQLEQWESTTLKNSVLLTDSEGGRVNGVFLRGTQLLVPNHFILQVRAKNHKFYVKAMNISTPQEFLLSRCHYVQCKDLQGLAVDLGILTLPNTTPQRPCILSKFATGNQLALAPDCSAVISGVRKLGDTPSIFTHHTDKFEVISRSIEYGSNRGTCRINSALKYDVDTKAGDCGCLVYTKNTAIAGKIIGYHLAGHNGMGLAMPISREFLERNLQEAEALPRQTTDARVPFTAQSKLSEIRLENSLPAKTLALAGNCLALGVLPKTHVPSKTQIEPSLVAGTLQEPTMKPAHLKPVKVNGILVDPMVKGMQKIMNVSQPLRRDILETVMDDVRHLHAGGNSDKRVLGFEEAILGDPNDSLYAPLNRSTSAGYPYSIGQKEPGKRHYFGYDTYEFSDEVRNDVMRLIEQASNNQRGDVVWNATLKDERRPIAKVDQIKTRVFAAGPQHYTIAFRQYFLGFMAHVARNKIHNEIGVGTNVYSMDWHYTALKLQQHGDKVIAGDFSNYDGSLLAEVMWEILDLINDWYDDGPANAQIRQVLFQDICHARILVGEELIQSDHSQPSGNPGTVIFNSLFNQIIMRYAYLLCKEKAGMPMICDFTDHVSMQAYGDDNVLNISDNVIEWYNQITISEALATIGMTYTDEAKTGELVQYRSLADIGYLKRQFKLNESGIYQAPLDVTVCKEMPNWIKNVKGMRKDATYENCLASIREFYFHGLNEYNQARNQLHAALVRADIKQRLPTFKEMDAFFVAGLFD